MGEVKEIEILDTAFKDLITTLKEQTKAMLDSDSVKFVGFEIYFLDEKNDVCQSFGFWAKGFNKEDYGV